MIGWIRDLCDWFDDWIYYVFGPLDPFDEILVYLIAFLLTMALLSLIFLGVVNLHEMLC